MTNLLHLPCALLRAFPFSVTCLTALAWLTPANPASAELVAFGFSGEVASLNGNPARYFNIPISSGDSVAGSFVLDTLSPVTSVVGGTTNYRQLRPDGFVVKIGSNEVRTDDYTVSIFDTTSGYDAMIVRFSTFSNSNYPTNDPPLTINGTDEAAARLQFTFSAPDTLLNSGAIPALSMIPSLGSSPEANSGTLTNSSFINGASFRGLGTLTQIPVPAPEPSGLVIAGSLFLLTFLRSKVRRRKYLA